MCAGCAGGAASRSLGEVLGSWGVMSVDGRSGGADCSIPRFGSAPGSIRHLEPMHSSPFSYFSSLQLQRTTREHHFDMPPIAWTSCLSSSAGPKDFGGLFAG